MDKQLKGFWLIVLLVAAGAVIFILGLRKNSVPEQEHVVLGEVFSQGSPQAASASADPIPSMAIVTSPDHGLEANFAVQVYSFQDKKRADAALEVLKNSGYAAYIIVSDLGEKGTWYRVRIGGIADEPSAQKMLEQVRKNYNSGFIVKPKK